MAEHRAGGFEYRGRTYHFDDARCRWMPSDLSIDAQGSRCGLRLVGVPFAGVNEIADLVGKVWEPDDDQLAIHADTFAEGGIEVRTRQLWMRRGRIECPRYDAGRGILTVSFRLMVEDDEDGREDEADGIAYCRVRG